MGPPSMAVLDRVLSGTEIWFATGRAGRYDRVRSNPPDRHPDGDTDPTTTHPRLGTGSRWPANPASWLRMHATSGTARGK